MEHVSNVWTDDQGVVRLECLSCGPLDPSGYHSPVVVSRTRDAATVEQLAGAWAQHLAEAVEDTDSDRKSVV